MGLQKGAGTEAETIPTSFAPITSVRTKNLIEQDKDVKKINKYINRVCVCACSRAREKRGAADGRVDSKSVWKKSW